MLRRLDRSGHIDCRQWCLEYSMHEKSTLDWTIVTWTEKFSDKYFFRGVCGFLEVIRLREVDVN